MAPPQQNSPYPIQTVTVYAASSAKVDQLYLRHAYDLGVAIAQQGWVQVNGGGETGLMGAATRGAIHANGVVDCVNLRQFVDQRLYKRYRHVQVEESLQARKLALFQRADALVTLPGGLGTLDELAEQMCARQLAHHAKPIVVLNTNGFYNSIRQFIRDGEESCFIAPAMSQAIHFVDTPSEVVKYLREYTPVHVNKHSINSSELNAVSQSYPQ